MMTFRADPLACSAIGPMPDPFILLVDDHLPSLQHLRMVVESAGHPCVAKSSPQEALAFGWSRRPSLVVTDLAMPRLNGRSLARGLKARYPLLPIVLVTGELLDDATLASLRRTFSDVLTKPLQVERLLDLIDGLLPPRQRPDTPTGP
jgi:CheY-like chemotaxis protein